MFTRLSLFSIYTGESWPTKLGQFSLNLLLNPSVLALVSHYKARHTVKKNRIDYERIKANTC